MRILGVVEYGAGSAAEAVAGHARRRAVPRGRHLLTLRGSIETVAASRRCHPRGTARPNAAEAPNKLTTRLSFPTLEVSLEADLALRGHNTSRASRV